MMRYWILGVLWLVGCGAGAPLDEGEDSTLRSRLSANDEDGSADDRSDTGDADEGGVVDPTAEGEAGGVVAPQPDPQVVVGAGGQPWHSGAGVVVWCHASVPLACPVSEPAASGGQLVVVQPSHETGEFEREAPATAGDAAPVPGVPVSVLPVDVGGSLPPLPGTCVAITFAIGAGASEAGDATPVAGVAVDPAAGDDGDGVAVDPVAGDDGDGVAVDPVAGDDGDGAAVDPVAGGDGDVADHAAAGGDVGLGVPVPGLPALPPLGGCIGVSFPVPSDPVVPGEPAHAGAGTIAPTPEASGGCLSVAFASNGSAGTSFVTPVSAGSSVPGAPSAPPQLCPVQDPVAGVPAIDVAPSGAGGYPTPASDPPTPAAVSPEEEVR